MHYLIYLIVLISIAGCGIPDYDLFIKNANIIDGSGSQAYQADIAIKDGIIVEIDQKLSGSSKSVLNAKGLTVTPGFIDMLSWACGPILYDGNVESVVQQGITTAIFGEGWSMGPVNDSVRSEMKGWWPEYEIQYNWETLTDYLKYVEQKGTSVNVGSYVGATTVRMHEIGFKDRKATEEEMERMKDLVRREMEAGAFGVASSLVYTPAFYADTHELTELAKVAAEYDGVYASHIRSESSDFISALDEFITICKDAGISGEIYHLKAAGKENWNKLDNAITKIEKARKEGLDIAADIYPYTAGATGLSAMMPPWAKDGGSEELINRLQNPAMCKKIKLQIQTSFNGWENFYWMADGGKNIIVSYLSEKNKDLQGKTIAEIAANRNMDEIDTIFELLIEESGGGGGIYFLMPEENVIKKMQLPWVTFCTDEDAYKPVGLMSKRNPHPRAYGTFPRILGKYVREQNVITLEEAIRKMTFLPASKLGLKNRGLIKKGYAADINIFDSDKIIDKATYTEPHQFPEGMFYVIVNGMMVVANGKHTGAQPGKALFKN
jgi:N-acyl-D-aspartate/D-glutamate deacylase